MFAQSFAKEKSSLRGAGDGANLPDKKGMERYRIFNNRENHRKNPDDSQTTSFKNNNETLSENKESDCSFSFILFNAVRKLLTKQTF